MNYTAAFRSLLHRLENTGNEQLQYVGLGNPNAKVLFVGKECAIDCSTPRGENCYQMERGRNLQQWSSNLQHALSLEDVAYWAVTIDEELFNPLYPYRGQRNIKAIRSAEGSVKNGGTSATWHAYQHLIDKLREHEISSTVDFHRYAFHTDFSAQVQQHDVYSLQTQASIHQRCEKMLGDSFFRTFPLVVVGCGRYVQRYGIDIEKVFDQQFLKEEKNENGWMRIYVKEGRMLIHTRNLSNSPESFLDTLALKMKNCLLQPLLKYCVYYDGTDASLEKSLMAFYEKHWVWHSLLSTYNAEAEILDMRIHGISEAWLDSFHTPRSLIGLFFNRYTHWVGCWKKEGFMSWFEEVRKGNIKNESDE